MTIVNKLKYMYFKTLSFISGKSLKILNSNQNQKSF